MHAEIYWIDKVPTGRLLLGANPGAVLGVLERSSQNADRLPPEDAAWIVDRRRQNRVDANR